MRASAPSNLTAAIADGGVILNWSSPAQNAPSVTGYDIPAAASEGGRGHTAGPCGGHRFHGHHLRGRHGQRAGGSGTSTGSGRFVAARGVQGPNHARVDLPEETDETGPTPVPAPRGVNIQPSNAQSGDPCPDPAPTPTAVDVTAVPIVVESTTDDYFVLYVNHDVDGTEVEFPVLVKRGEAGTTTLAENVGGTARRALPGGEVPNRRSGRRRYGLPG